MKNFFIGLQIFLIVALNIQCTKPPKPSCSGVIPASGHPGTTLNVAITGSNTCFINGVSVASFSCPGITVNSTAVDSPTQTVANITIAPDAPVGACDVIVTTFGQIVTCPAAFNITLTFTCDVDTSKTGYELAGSYDDCLVWNAQKTMTHIESKDIDIRATKLPLLEFSGSYAVLNAAENWIQPFYTFITETGAYPTPSASINNVVLAKLKAKDSVDDAFNFSNDLPQGICADVQQEVYDTVLNNVLSKDERDKYLSQGKQLSFILDDDLPPLSTTTNPVNNGSAWLDVDPATKVTHEGSNYFYEPLSLYVTLDDPNISDERFKGVRYCKLLSHQAILSWMLEKSFEDNPVLITPSKPVCDEPSSLDSGNGSCLFYSEQYDNNYFCADFTGSGFTPENAQEKCNTNTAYKDEVYSTSPCSARTEEIEAYILGYQGLTGICVVHCKESNEFILNIYNDNPETRCGGFEFFYPGELGK